MDIATTIRLLGLNRQFYQNFGEQFAETRRRLQPGVKRILNDIQPTDRILDLGCGNGELWLALARAGHGSSSYVGIDFSPQLLQIAIERASEIKSDDEQDRTNNGCLDAPGSVFLQADIASTNWDASLPAPAFDLIIAFAVLHHLPSYELRLRILRKIRNLLSVNGKFIHSEWMFLNSPRLRARVLPWEKVGLSPDEVDSGDYLLDWRHGGYGLRYAHHFSETELEQLADESGFQITEAFLSDGEGGKLGLYQVWETSHNKSTK